MDDIGQATEAASLAVQFDQLGHAEKAIECYRTAARLLGRILDRFSPEKQAELRNKVNDYLQRATFLDEKKETVQQAASERMMQQCFFIVQQAVDADEAGLADLATQLYTRAVELAVSGQVSDPEDKAKVNQIAKQALDRAEALRGISNLNLNEAKSQAHAPSAPPLEREQSVHLKVSGRDSYSEEEKRVLMQTSRINDNTFLPFMDVDLNERFQYALPFEDADGRLRLSPKQRAEFARWVRPHELCAAPALVADLVDCYSIKQTIVSDCSLVASLAVAAQHERRFQRPLVTGILYPRGRRGPVYSPFGKYMVKLHLNGVRRKVIIDELLPYSRDGRLLCSYSSNKSEFWVSIVEKAYMKVMGGYDFPGSNSNIDLHALTGWIPERCPLPTATTTTALPPDTSALHTALQARWSRGEVLATAATGQLSLADEERTGLVASHAYAVLDVREVDGVQLLKLKNPWSHLRWRGNYSELDVRHWTPALRARLDYDPDSAAQYDNGVFWIDFASIVKFFDVLYLNWDPAMFQYTYCIHQEWDAGTGPIRDAYTVGACPQYSLRARAAVWLLLTRHITSIDDFRENKEYIALVVYEGGGRVYYPNDPPPIVDGARINSPHYLCKLPPPPPPGPAAAAAAGARTLLVAQYEKSRTIRYTLRAYSTAPFVLRPLPAPPHQYTKAGEWSGATAGGCENHPLTYAHNPKVTLTLPRPAALVLQLKGPKEYQLGLDVRVVRLLDPAVTAPFVVKNSGAYRSGYVVLQLDDLPAGTYRVCVSTYYPAQEGPFILEIHSTCEVTFG